MILDILVVLYPGIAGITASLYRYRYTYCCNTEDNIACFILGIFWPITLGIILLDMMME